jgi:hypothetical protein
MPTAKTIYETTLIVTKHGSWFVLFRVNSWIAFMPTAKTIHETTLNGTKRGAFASCEFVDRFYATARTIHELTLIVTNNLFATAQTSAGIQSKSQMPSPCLR